VSDSSNELQGGITPARCLFLNYSGAGTEAAWELKSRIPSPTFSAAEYCSIPRLIRSCHVDGG
jgi:hypothetical protein